MSTAPDKLAGIRSKIEWTKKHVADLEALVRAFLYTEPYKIVIKHDPDITKVAYCVGHVDAVPPVITLTAGDAIANMVGILDHLAFSLFKKGGGSGDGRHIYFPIDRKAQTITEYKAKSQGKVKGLSLAAIAAIESLEPYQGGKGHQLWVLNELNNLSKHRELIAVGSRYRSLDIGASGIRSVMKELGRTISDAEIDEIGGSLVVNFSNPLCPVKVGDVLLSAHVVDRNIDKDMKFIFDIALYEPQIIEAKSLIETIHHLRGLVGTVAELLANHL